MIVEDRENYRVDGYLMKDWVVPDPDTPPFEHDLEKFELEDWHAIVQGVDLLNPDPDPDPEPEPDDRSSAIATNTALNFTNPDSLTIPDGSADLVQRAFNRAVEAWNDLVTVSGVMRDKVLAVDADFAGLQVSEMRWVNSGLAGCIQSSDDFVPHGDADDIRMIGTTCIFVVNVNQLTTAGGDWGEDDMVTVMKHELCHGMGIGRWDFAIGGNVAPSDPEWLLDGNVYDLALLAYQNITSVNAATGTPLENVGGAGTIGSHWERRARIINGVNYRGLSDELMVGGASPGARRVISSVTLENLRELGYTIIGEPEGVPNLGRYANPADVQFTCFDY